MQRTDRFKVNSISTVLKNKSALVKDLSSSTLSTLIVSILQFATQVFVVRLILKEEYGIYVFTYAIFSIIELLPLSFMSEFAQQRASKPIVDQDRLEANDVLSFLYKLDLKLCLIFGLLVLAIGLFIPVNGTLNTSFFVVFAFSLFFQFGSSLAKAILIALNEVVVQSMQFIYAAIFSFLITIPLIYFLGLKGLLLSIPICTLIKTISGYIAVNRYTNYNIGWNLLTGITNFKFTEEDKRFTFLAVIRNSFLQLTNKLDILLIGGLAGPAILAVYKIAKSITSIISKGIVPIWSGLRGRMVEALHKSQFQRLRDIVFKTSYIMIGLFLLGMPLMYYFADFVIVSLYGEEYIDAVGPFLILAIGSVLFFITSAWFDFWIIIASKQSIGILVLIVQSFCLTLGLLLFKNHGLNYFAGVVSVSLILSSILHIFYFAKHSKQA